jgi:hypothetical protein
MTKTARAKSGKKIAQVSTNLFVFVLMPFTKRLNKRYEAIKFVVEKAGMLAQRVDREFFLREGITDRIIRQIESADVLVADLSSENLNVMYEVGWAHAKDQLCIPLTDDPKKIPFDIKDRRHVIFGSLKDLKAQLSRELEALRAEAELSYDPSDSECFVRTVRTIRPTVSVQQSTAVSIRVKVRTSSELHRKRVRAHITKIERRVRNERKRFDLVDPIPLTWANNDNAQLDFDGAADGYANVFHIDHDDNKLTIWKFDMPQPLQEFFDAKGIYRVTVTVLGRNIRLDVDWPRDWKTMTVKRVQRRLPNSA